MKLRARCSAGTLAAPGAPLMTMQGSHGVFAHGGWYSGTRSATRSVARTYESTAYTRP